MCLRCFLCSAWCFASAASRSTGDRRPVLLSRSASQQARVRRFGAGGDPRRTIASVRRNDDGDGVGRNERRYRGDCSRASDEYVSGGGAPLRPRASRESRAGQRHIVRSASRRPTCVAAGRRRSAEPDYPHTRWRGTGSTRLRLMPCRRTPAASLHHASGRPSAGTRRRRTVGVFTPAPAERC